MPYELEFKKSALKEWNKLGATAQIQLTKKLRAVLENPKVLNTKLSGDNHLYKIKLHQAGYRLAYEVNNKTIIVVVIAAGKRKGSKAYKATMKRRSE
ncbi:MAG: type II toxin-antitoxin system RelE/ParE family toxin [Spongiibacteraceae bacterium]